MTVTPLPADSRRYNMLDLENHIGSTSVNDTVLKLGVARAAVMGYRRGLTRSQAEELADRADVDPADVWADWTLDTILDGPPAQTAPVGVSERAVAPEPDTPPQSTGVEIVWEDPPGRGATLTPRRAPWQTDEILATIKSRPGKWARIWKYDKKGSAGSAAARINRKPFTLGPGWKASASVDKQAGGSWLYLRWDGEQ